MNFLHILVNHAANSNEDATEAFTLKEYTNINFASALFYLDSETPPNRLVNTITSLLPALFCPDKRYVFPNKRTTLIRPPR